ncbi:hypothetical protein [Paenibacillus sp. GM2]|uniref:hypothetical protein n=1 Tax=Paenibacillus sp. GM2 TaxID=1622070 RepID=UPI0011DC8407|nr:hypothetical protein [Paenibacillus sp. GM2]
MRKRIDVAELAVAIQNDTNKLFKDQITELARKASEGNISKQEVIAHTAVALQTNMSVFIISLLQNVVDELQKNNE